MLVIHLCSANYSRRGQPCFTFIIVIDGLFLFAVAILKMCNYRWWWKLWI